MQSRNCSKSAVISSSSEANQLSTDSAVYCLENSIDSARCRGVPEEKLVELLNSIASVIELVRFDGAHAYMEEGKGSSLSPRLREVLELIESGQTPQEIAETLTISVRTVRRHIEILKFELEEASCSYRRLPIKAREIGAL